jgi:hypothetical protein
VERLEKRVEANLAAVGTAPWLSIGRCPDCVATPTPVSIVIVLCVVCAVLSSPCPYPYPCPYIVPVTAVPYVLLTMFYALIALLRNSLENWVPQQRGCRTGSTAKGRPETIHS